LLRALTARWFQYARETGNSDEQKRNDLLQGLSKSLPAFYLPQLTWRGMALKQYQPTEVVWTDASMKAAAYRAPQKTLVEDHYRAVSPDEPILWYWEDLTLSGQQRDLLDKLLERTQYFGRAEGFCRLRRINAIPDGIQPNTFLVERDDGSMTPVLVPLPQNNLNLAALLAFTDGEELRGRAIPPGTAWYYAAIPQKPIVAGAVKHAQPIDNNSLNSIQFAVGGRVYPPLDRWVKLTERFRGRVIRHLSEQMTGDPRSHYGRLTPEQRDTLALISGKDGAGRPLHGHQHAFFLLWPDDNARPTRLIVWRRQPFTAREVEALTMASAYPLSWENGVPNWSVHTVPLSLDTPLPAAFIAEARVWRSVTPFVPPAGRHRFRKNGRERSGESPEHLLTKLLQKAGKPAPNKVTLIQGQGEMCWMNLHETRQRRQLRKEIRTPWVRPGVLLQIEFEKSVHGPLVLGDSSHFGLGLFVPAGIEW